VVNLGVSSNQHNIVLYNSRSINCKTEVLRILYDAHDPLIIGITESWLKPKTLNECLGVNDLYDVVRRDRKGGRKGGGVCMLIKKGTPFVQLDKPNDNCESLWIDVVCANPFRVGLFYRPGTLPRDPAIELLSSITNEIDELVSDQNKPCFIMGDFNFPTIDWSVPMCQEDRGMAVTFLDSVQEACLEQYVNEPTRGNNVLDLVLCNDPTFVVSADVSCALQSDHAVVVAQVAAGKVVDEDETESVPAFHLAHYEKIAEFLDAVDWIGLANEFQHAKEFWDAVHCVIIFCIEKFVPKKVLKRRGFMRRNRHIKTMVRRLQRMFKDLGCTVVANQCAEYKALQSRITKAKRDQTYLEENRILSRNCSKSFFGCE
jgi:hypothetical protein